MSSVTPSMCFTSTSATEGSKARRSDVPAAIASARGELPHMSGRSTSGPKLASRSNSRQTAVCRCSAATVSAVFARASDTSGLTRARSSSRT
eukprot:1061250-Prymnesium_polylepis.1